MKLHFLLNTAWFIITWIISSCKFFLHKYIYIETPLLWTRSFLFLFLYISFSLSCSLFSYRHVAIWMCYYFLSDLTEVARKKEPGTFNFYINPIRYCNFFFKIYWNITLKKYFEIFWRTLIQKVFLIGNTPALFPLNW